jgi:hypothetical protein
MRRAPAFALALVLAALLPGPAHAATYAVQTCTNGSLAGWTHFNLGDWSSTGNGCGVPGAGMSAEIDAPAWSTAGWRFTAPADTEIAGFRVTRSYRLAADRPYGTSVYSLATEGSGRDYRAGDVNLGGARTVPPATEVASGLTGQTALSVHVDCAGGLGCTGRSGLVVFDARLELSDDAAPAITATSGTLLAAGPLAGTRALSFSATDRGGGLLRARLLVDGQTLAEGSLDAGATACAGPPFAAVVPCPLSASTTLALDTRRLAEGRHEVQLVVFDATGVNKAVHGPVEVFVDNVPPPASVSAPRLAGTAREGETLVAADGEWTGAGLTLARRWQRLEDGAWEDVDGADGVAYTVARGDVGRRLRVRVRASNAEGAAEAASAPTAVVTGLAAATPAPSPAPPPGPVVPGAPIAPVAIPAPADGRAVLRAVFESAGRSATTLRWGESRRIAGTLRRPDGQPIAAARIAVTSLARVASAAPVPLAAATTDGDGRFTYTLRPGVSRTLTFAYGAARATVAARVIPHVILHARRSGTVVRLSGRIPGTPAGLRKRVELQVRRGTTWRTFTTTRLTSTGGRFSYRHRTRATRFRAVVRAEPGWPFLTASATARAAPPP